MGSWGGRAARWTVGALLLLTSRVEAQNKAVPGTEGAYQKIQKHIDEILGEEKGAASKYKQIAQRAARDGKNKTYTIGGRTFKGADEHPWKGSNGNNPNSESDYKQDSVDVTDDERFSRQLYSCWEPQLLAKGWWFVGDTPPGSREEMAPGSIDLGLACKASCPLMPWALIGRDNGYEVIQYWWPEHEVYTNNYGINRLNPQEQSQHGQKFGRRELLQQERQPEQQTEQLLSTEYPLQLKQLNKLDALHNQDPFRGQEQWGGYAVNAVESEENIEVHGARTRVAYRTSDAKPNSDKGWKRSEIMIYDAFPPKTNQKDIINEWTESGMWNVLAHIPDVSRKAGQRGQRAMQALFGNQQPITQAAKEKPPFWQSKGAMAFRVGRWPNEYGGLQRLLEIQSDNNQTLREVTYHGGVELFPLTTNLSGFTVPTLSASVVLARRGLYMMGTKDLLQFHDGGGQNGEKYRMNEYTIMNSDKGREIDKMQLIYPRVKGAPSECFRTQVGAANYPDTTQDQWVKQNLPHDLVGYVKDQYGDVSFIYWNKRVSCTCRYQGIPTGAWTMDFPGDGLGPGRGSGDRPYGKIEDKLCTYRERRAPSSFMNDDSPTCTNDPNTTVYKGLQDNV